MQDCTRAREIAFDHNILDPLVPFSLSLSLDSDTFISFSVCLQSHQFRPTVQRLRD